MREESTEAACGFCAEAAGDGDGGCGGGSSRDDDDDDDDDGRWGSRRVIVARA